MLQLNFIVIPFQYIIVTYQHHHYQPPVVTASYYYKVYDIVITTCFVIYKVNANVKK